MQLPLTADKALVFPLRMHTTVALLGDALQLSAQLLWLAGYLWLVCPSRLSQVCSPVWTYSA